MALPLAQLHFNNFTVSLPAEKIGQVTLNRPQKLNAIDKATSKEIAEIQEAFDNGESLWVGIITGIWNEMNRNGVVNDMSAPGLAKLPRRTGKKPIIATVNGITMGGGFEMIANRDLILATSSATFALPETKRGIMSVAGCLPRLTRTLGLQRTSDLVLTGPTVSAQTLQDWGLISHIVSKCCSPDRKEICQNRPDALIVGREGIRLRWESGNVEETVSKLEKECHPRLVAGNNFKEGIQAFVEKRAPRWTDSKL